MPRRAFASRNSGSKTSVDFNSSTSALCRGTPNFVGKSLRTRAMTCILISCAISRPPFPDGRILSHPPRDGKAARARPVVTNWWQIGHIFEKCVVNKAEM